MPPTLQDHPVKHGQQTETLTDAVPGTSSEEAL